MSVAENENFTNRVLSVTVEFDMGTRGAEGAAAGPKTSHHKNHLSTVRVI